MLLHLRSKAIVYSRDVTFNEQVEIKHLGIKDYYTLEDEGDSDSEDESEAYNSHTGRENEEREANTSSMDYEGTPDRVIIEEDQEEEKANDLDEPEPKRMKTFHALLA